MNSHFRAIGLTLGVLVGLLLALPNAPLATLAGGSSILPTTQPDYHITQGLGATLVPGVTDTGNHCDDCGTLITLPFPFRLYDRTVSTATVLANGRLAFDVPNLYFDNACLPNDDSEYHINAYWDDLTTQATAGNCWNYPGNSCGVYTSVSGSAPHRIFNIEWRAVYAVPPNAGEFAHFEIRLYEQAPNSRFSLIYDTAARKGASATIGVEQTQEGAFTQFSCNQQVVRPGLIVTFDDGPTNWSPAAK